MTHASVDVARCNWGGSIDTFLLRLDGVQQSGPDYWLAKCPAHDDRSPSLSVRDVGDRILIHCFAGCDPLDVVHAVGLELRDLFEKPPSGESPVDWRSGRRRSRIPARDILQAIDHEAVVVACIGADFLEHRQLLPEIWDRLAIAVSRIGAARDISR